VDPARLRRSIPSALATAAVTALAIAIATVVFEDRGAPHAGTHSSSHAAPGAQSVADLTVADLTGPLDGVPDVRFELTARKAQVVLDSGFTTEGLRFNGAAPGPELQVRAGQLVEVVLRNADVTEGVTLHWHGLDVPNAEDSVAGVTQDAVPPGERMSTGSGPSRSAPSGTTPTRTPRAPCTAGSTVRSSWNRPAERPGRTPCCSATRGCVPEPTRWWRSARATGPSAGTWHDHRLDGRVRGPRTSSGVASLTLNVSGATPLTFPPASLRSFA
jgi:hypothetical protein